MDKKYKQFYAVLQNVKLILIKYKNDYLYIKKFPNTTLE